MGSIALEEYELMKDSKYRVYVSAVDKALKNFDYTSEWADLISALGKLNKVLMSHQKFPVIPRRIKISKRLAQCMHPALPSGVHLKALETYDIIFRCMGTNRLSHELFIYSAGLFPLLGHSAMNVRPSLLKVYETHFVPLGERLRPGLSGFLSGVLPGLEEGSDHFDRTNSLLEKVCEGVGASHFYSCVWECMAANNAIRLPAISFVLSHFNKKLTMEDQLFIMGTNIDVMVMALCAGVQDTSVLVQRSALDLLLVGFPMHNSQLVRADMVRLVTAALGTILRRDMSLNRRLFAWLLGSEVNISLLSSEHPLVKCSKLTEQPNANPYFEHYSRDMLVQAIKTTLSQSINKLPHDLRPYRLLVSLLDKPDIGPVVLDDILYEVFRALYSDCGGRADLKPGENTPGSTYKGCQELLKSANLLFSTLEPCYIWQYVATLYTGACQRLPGDPGGGGQGSGVLPVGSGPPSLVEVCALTEFLLDIVSLESYLETPSEHLPSLFLHLVSQLTDHCAPLSPLHISTSLRLAAKILSRVQPSARPEPKPPVVDPPQPVENQSELGDRTRANSDLTEYKTSKAMKTKLKKSKTDSKIKKLNSKNHVESGPILLSVVYNGDDEEKRVYRHLSTPHLESFVVGDGGEVVADRGEAVADGGQEDESHLAVSIAVPTKQQTVLEQCKRQYENFFVRFVASNRRLLNGQVDDLYRRLLDVRKSRESDAERTGKLERLLQSCLDKSSPPRDLPTTDRTTHVEPKREERGEEAVTEGEAAEWEEPMRLSCHLLVELSTFPSYRLADDDPVITDNFRGEVTLPDWLRVLLSCACGLPHAPGLQLVAAATLLDLVCLPRSTAAVPLLRPWHLAFIRHHTNAMQVLAGSLWHHLGTAGPAHQVTCVDLLHRLHTVAQCDAVELVIGGAMASESREDRMEAFQRFATLWHVGRDLAAKGGTGSGTKTLDKSLLKMLDNLLLNESCPLKLHAQTWLIHSLLRGDIARIVDPLLHMLLDPCTARMSVLHVRVQHSNTVVVANAKDNDYDENAATAKIYAISSEDGNVIYHVQDSNKLKKNNSNPVRAKRIFAVKTLVGREDTRHFITERSSYPDGDDIASKNMSVFVNPFNASSNTDSTEDDSGNDKSFEFLRGATRLSRDGKRDSVVEESPAEIVDAGSTTNVKGIKSEAAQKLGGFKDGGETGGYELASVDFKSWSTEDLEMSTPAEEFFNAGSSVSVVESILDDILGAVVARSESRSDETNRRVNLGVGFHPLHQHMLLYCGVYDSNRTLYALRTLRSVLLTNAQMFLCAAATTGVANLKNGNCLITLLARHRKSVFGKSFHGDVGSIAEFATAYRSSMYLEVLIAVCLYFARSFYPNLGQMRLTAEEIAGNRQVQLASAELLMLICAELILIVRDSGRGFACYIADMLSRCKVQKVVLHCVFSSVYNMKTNQDQAVTKFSERHTQQRTFTEEIVSFNDPACDCPETASDNVPTKCKYQCSEHSEGFQIQLLRLLLALIMLEHQVSAQQGDANEVPKEGGAAAASSESQLRYVPTVAVPQQPMFLAAVLTALEFKHSRHLHQQWTTLVTSALPFMGPSLTPVVMKVITQLCINVEQLTACYATTQESNGGCCLPVDYTVTQLEALTVLCHYCLLDSAQQQSHAFGQLSAVAAPSIPGVNPGQIFNNLVHVFMATPLSQESNGAKDKTAVLEAHLAARRTVLSNLPRIIASVAVLWQTIISNKDWEHQSNVLGNPRVVKHQLLEFLSPISLHHGVNFLAAIAVAWQDRKPTTNRKVIPVATPSQQVLVYLVSAIRVMPIDTLVQTVHQVVKQPPPIQGATKELSLEVSVLELFYCYIQTGPQLAESWPSLLGLLRDGLTLTPPAQFLMLAILNQFIQQCPPLPDKKDHRDLQDITAKLVESCTQIAGACLEQTNWLRRNLAVREDDLSVTGTKLDGVVNSMAQYSVQAQTVLAELLAPLLDVSYGSQEKERVVALLTALMANIVPYLKNHTVRNVCSFHACSQLLASLSSYQYTRKAWRKDVFDLLLDPALFQMEPNCLAYWKTIVDNLMTHDNTTFRDLMTRVSVAQSNSLSIFSSREAEYEVRAQLLKRLAFVILCSEIDQYHKYMPEIQERLADSLRLPQVVPAIQAQVFLCFRVLLLRMSPHHVTSLWPIIISEMVQVFLHVEQELAADTDQFSSHIRLMSALDWSWVVNSSNGLHAHGHPHWLQLQLAAAKLLDTAVLLPAHHLPQFQMYRWAFVGDADSTGVNNNGNEDDALRSTDFVPHVVRIARLMDTKYACPFVALSPAPGHLLLEAGVITSLEELRPFFSALSVQADRTGDVSIDDLERVVEADFLERLPAK